jgi:hypothetical protein
MQRLAVLIPVLLALLLPAGCSDREPVFDEDAWYNRDVPADPTSWAVGDWLYDYDGQTELLVLNEDGRYAWRLQLPRRDPLADVGEWYGDRAVIELISDTTAQGASEGPPPMLIRVPTARGAHLVTPNLLERWREAGFEPGDYPRGGQAFQKVE